jgi:propanediol utilization protein
VIEADDDGFVRRQRQGSLASRAAVELALTDSAVEAVKGIVSSAGEVSETGGLRLVAERAGMQPTLQLSRFAARRGR